MSNPADTATDPVGAVSVRLGGSGDREVIARHREQARVESSRYRGRIPAITGSEVAMDEVIVIGRVGSSDVGSLVASPDAGAATIGSEWMIGHVFVESDFREVGVADAIVTAALEELARRGVSHVRAYAQPGDRSLKNLFERHGLVAETITVGRALGK